MTDRHRYRRIPAGFFTLLLALIIGGGGLLLAAWGERLLPDETGRVHTESVEDNHLFPNQMGQTGPVTLYPWQYYDSAECRPLTDKEQEKLLSVEGIDKLLLAYLPGKVRSIDVGSQFVAIDNEAMELSTVYYLHGAAVEVVDPSYYSVQTYLVDCAVLPGKGILSFHREPQTLANRAADSETVRQALSRCQTYLGDEKAPIYDRIPDEYDDKYTIPSLPLADGSIRETCLVTLQRAFSAGLDGAGALEQLQIFTRWFGIPEWLTTSREIGIVYTLSATSNIVLTYDVLTDNLSGFSLRLDS